MVNFNGLRKTVHAWCRVGILVLVFSVPCGAQEALSRLRAAVKDFGADAQLKHASWSLVVADAASGKILFDKDGELALAPASTLKVLTSIAALDLLGKDYRFETEIGYRGILEDGVLGGDLVVRGSGDPSFGSGRYNETGWQLVLDRISAAVQGLGVKVITGNILVDSTGWNAEPVPDGWIWQDIGNYYGAGCWKLNWRENQFDVKLQSGPVVGSPVKVVATNPVLPGIRLRSELVAGPKGSGDNAYIYLPPGSGEGVIRGSIPAGENAFSIAGAMPDPAEQFAAELKGSLAARNIIFRELGAGQPSRAWSAAGNKFSSLSRFRSPALDSLVYWFLRKSINLYGEAMLRTLGWKQKGRANNEAGVAALRSFWESNGLPPDALQIIDGSGLSPQNRVTAKLLVDALRYARKRSWFPSFYEALPLYNGMKLKSGSISGARAYAGYHRASDGKQYTIAILVNNYSGSSSSVVKKIFRLLDQLK